MTKSNNATPEIPDALLDARKAYAAALADWNGIRGRQAEAREQVEALVAAKGQLEAQRAALLREQAANGRAPEVTARLENVREKLRNVADDLEEALAALNAFDDGLILTAAKEVSRARNILEMEIHALARKNYEAALDRLAEMAAPLLAECMAWGQDVNVAYLLESLKDRLGRIEAPQRPEALKLALEPSDVRAVLERQRSIDAAVSKAEAEARMAATDGVAYGLPFKSSNKPPLITHKVGEINGPDDVSWRGANGSEMRGHNLARKEAPEEVEEVE